MIMWLVESRYRGGYSFPKKLLLVMADQIWPVAGEEDLEIGMAILTFIEFNLSSGTGSIEVDAMNSLTTSRNITCFTGLVMF